MHLRKREIAKIFTKKSKIFPVLGLLGPRQVGKSTFLIHEWAHKLNATYITLDSSIELQKAKKSPEDFLIRHTENLTKKIIIDEIQKAPRLFDSIKFLVDQNRRIGLFTVSGSVEFSNISGVRESLTGRIGLNRLYPLNISELSKSKPARQLIDLLNGKINLKVNNVNLKKHKDTWLERGGIPIFCGLGDKIERSLQIENWIQTICYRDIQELNLNNLNGSIAIEILRLIAHEPLVNISVLAKEISTSRLSVQKHINALESLFIIYKLPNYANRTAHNQYSIFDTALLNYWLDIKNPISEKLQHKIFLLNEIYSQFQNYGQMTPEIFHYSSDSKSTVDLVIKTKEKITGINLYFKSTEPSNYELRSINSFLKKYPSANFLIFAPIQEVNKITKNITMIPWETILS